MGMFLDAFFFCKFFEHCSSTSMPLAPSPTPGGGGSEGGMGGDGVG